VNEARQGEVWSSTSIPPAGASGRAGVPPCSSPRSLGIGPQRAGDRRSTDATGRPNPLYWAIKPPEGAVRETSCAMPDMVRAVSRQRLVERRGIGRDATLEQMRQRLRLLVRSP
jgi:hypothetical protein